MNKKLQLTILALVTAFVLSPLFPSAVVDASGTDWACFYYDDVICGGCPTGTVCATPGQPATGPGECCLEMSSFACVDPSECVYDANYCYSIC